MGIPKFFKYIVKDNPDLLIDNVKELDDLIQNLYFDLNCLIYPCVSEIEKKNQSDLKVHNKEIFDKKYENLDYLTKFEEKLFSNILEYINKIVLYANPTKMVYLSIDGVAPRAKMEQQRLRRYRSVKLKKMKNEIYDKNNIVKCIFDTNCISPGTIFMYKLSKYLQIECEKMKNKLNLNIYLDDSSNRGEGEHKILQHIKKYKKHEINCIYGLDADLIMLSIVSESKVYLLRESVHFSKIDRDHLILFDCEKFSDDIYKKISDIIISYKFETEEDNENENNDEDELLIKERIIRDYLCMCFFIGNDFLPPIIGLDINLNSIHSIIKIYSKILNIRKKHLVSEDLTINFIFVRQIMTELFNNEADILRKYQNNINNKNIHLKKTDPVELELEKIDYYPILNKKKRIIDFNDINWQNEYYKYYFHILNQVKEKNIINDICKNYVEGLQWNIKYYLDSCVSYSWYYKYRAAPILKDLTYYLSQRIYMAEFKDLKINPLEQLCIIMPIQSNHLWAKEFLKKVKNELSIAVDYPNDFELDIENKVFTHDANPILNNIEIDKIKGIFSEIVLSDLEKELNKSNDVYTYLLESINLKIS